MSQITLLECREADAAQNNANGDWQTVLNAPQVLMPGDQVILKTAAVDTRKATTGTITLESDVSATISGFPYVVNYEPTDKTYASGAAEPDFKRYYAAKLHTQPNGVTHKLLTSVTVQSTETITTKIDACTITANFTGPPVTKKNTIVNEAPAGTGSGANLPIIANTAALALSKGIVFIQSTKSETANFTVTGHAYANSATNQDEFIGGVDMVKGVPFFLTELFHDVTSILVANANTAGIITVGTMTADVPNTKGSIQIPQFKGGQKHVVPCSLHVASSVEPKDVQISNIPQTKASGLRPAGPKFTVTDIAISAATTNDGYFEPLEFTHDIEIPAGTYSTDALSTFINSSISRNKAESSSGSDLLVNDILKSSKYLGASETLFMVRENDSNDPEVFTFDTNDGDGSWIGCSTVQLGINLNTNCFEWQYLHTPYYDSIGPSPSGGPAIYYTQRNNDYFSTSAMMGIALTALSPSTFWQDQLGFGTDFATFTHGTTGRTIPSGGTSVISNTRFPTFNTEIGVSTTTQYVGADSVVKKKTEPYKVPNLAAEALTSTANLDNFVPVKAPIAYTTLAKDTTGYFLLDVQTNFKTEAIGSTDTSRTIQAIVGRFYNTGSFTIAGSDSGIVYQHVGAPQMIQSLSIRILHPDGTLADDVSNDSTLYFEIQRQIK